MITATTTMMTKTQTIEPITIPAIAPVTKYRLRSIINAIVVFIVNLD